MTHDPIAYTITDAEHCELSVSFGVDMAIVPTRLTGGQLDERKCGVMFLEMIGGHRISLAFSGRPELAFAATAALIQVERTAA